MGVARVIAFSLIVGAIGPVGPGREANGQNAGEKYALLVGVREYDPKELKSLQFPDRDVAELAKVLRESGYRDENVVVMTQELGAREARKLPTARNIRRELELLIGSAEEGDTVLVGLAGHGVQFRGEADSYFCPMDARLEDKTSLVALGEVYRALEGCPATLKLLLVDACRNDPQSRLSRSREVVELESVSRPQRVAPPGGVLALFSCSEGEQAFEHPDLGHGVFFHHVIEGLRGAESDLDGDGSVSPEELVLFTKRRVRDFARAKLGVLQRPESKGAVRDLVALIDRRPAGGLDRPDFAASIGIKIVPIQGDSFWMGSPDTDDMAGFAEKPRHRVRISAFGLAAHEVTVGQFRRFVADTNYKTEAEKDGKGGGGFNPVKGQFEQAPMYTWQDPGFPQSDDHPVTNVSWNDAAEFCRWLGRKDGREYRLPTEAEWEYACRAGSETRYGFGDDPEGLARVGNVADARAKSRFPGLTTIAADDGFVFTSPVGHYEANRWGLHDMHGNVWEWCLDNFGDSYYKKSPAEDPRGPSSTAALRVNRGGSWSHAARFARSADRRGIVASSRYNSLGFRVARVPSGK